MTISDVTPLGVGTPVTGDVRSVNFFNGRLLTAGDLRREQHSDRALRDRLGLGIGDGVVRGLRVNRPGGPDPLRPFVDVSGGLAVNRSGRALELGYDVRITLARAGAQDAAPAPRSGFADCSGLPGSSPLTQSGMYLLTVAPAGRPVGRAPSGGLGLGLQPVGCDTDACAEGVAFRAVRVAVDAGLLADAPRRRNRLAQLMLGTDDPRRTRLQRNPFGGGGERGGLLEDLRGRLLTDDEVPLACLLWTPGVGIEFVDEWSVRRRVASAGADSDFPELTGGRRRADGEARLLQFQAELADLAGALAGSPTTIAARDRFARLPAAGLLPLATSSFPRGFDLIRFFAGMLTRPATSGEDPMVADGAQLQALLELSLAGEPIDPASQEFVWTYLVRQNTEATPPVQPYLVFASGHLPPIAEAVSDLSRFDVSNYAYRLV
jgi:hypothetical protein